MKLRDMNYRMAYEVKMRKLLTFTIIYYNGGFQMAGGWLKVIISYHF